MIGINDEHESFALDINIATSTWYDESMEPHGRQRALDYLLLGTYLIKETK